MLNRHRLSAPAKSAPATWPAHNSRFGLVLSTVKYLLRTEVHTFAFSVAANAILSFFPFVLLLMTIIRRVFHSTVMYETVLRSEEHTSELQSPLNISYAVFCLK